MDIARIERATRVLGKSQGFRGLPIRDQSVNGKINGEAEFEMVSAWTPTPEELAKLNQGASVHLHVYGTEHPPVRIEVGEPPL